MVGGQLWLPGKRQSKQWPSLRDSYTLASSPASRKQSVNLTWSFVPARIPPFLPFHSFYTFLSFIYFPPVLQASSHISDSIIHSRCEPGSRISIILGIIQIILKIKTILNDSTRSIIPPFAFFTHIPFQRSDTDFIVNSILRHDNSCATGRTI